MVDEDFAKRIGLEIAGQAQGAAAQQSEPAVRRRRPLQAEARPAGRAGQGPQLPAAAQDGRGRVRRHLATGPGRQGSRQPAARGRREVRRRSSKDEYRKIAERRVRLGLVLAEIGRANNVEVTDQELNNAIMTEARNYPGQEQQVLDFYRQNPNAAAQMRAPIYEEKVCRPDLRHRRGDRHADHQGRAAEGRRRGLIAPHPPKAFDPRPGHRGGDLHFRRALHPRSGNAISCPEGCRST